MVQSIGNVDDCLGQCLKTDTRTKCKYFLSRTNWTECLRILLFGGIAVGLGAGCVCVEGWVMPCSYFHAMGCVLQLENPHIKKIHYIFYYSVTHADLTAGVSGIKHPCELLSRRQWHLVKHSPISL